MTKVFTQAEIADRVSTTRLMMDLADMTSNDEMCKRFTLLLDIIAQLQRQNAAALDAIEYALDAMEASGGWDGDEHVWDKLQSARAALSEVKP